MIAPVSLRLFCHDLQMVLSPSARLALRTSTALIPRNSFSTSQFQAANRVLDPVRIPPTFHDYLRSCAASNTLLLALFTTSACTICRTVTPLLEELISSRSPRPEDRFSSLALAETELDSPDQSHGNMMDLGIEYGITSLPTLAGFGGRRTERLTDKIVDVKMMSDEVRMAKWIDEQMGRGDPFGTSDGQGGGGLLARLFGGR